MLDYATIHVCTIHMHHPAICLNVGKHIHVDCIVCVYCTVTSKWQIIKWAFVRWGMDLHTSDPLALIKLTEPFCYNKEVGPYMTYCKERRCSCWKLTQCCVCHLIIFSFIFLQLWNLQNRTHVKIIKLYLRKLKLLSYQNYISSTNQLRWSMDYYGHTCSSQILYSS